MTIKTVIRMMIKMMMIKMMMIKMIMIKKNNKI